MQIYWMFLVVSVLMWGWYNRQWRVVTIEKHCENRPLNTQVIIFFSIIIIFCGLRSGVADTGTYIDLFNSYPSRVSEIEWDTVKIDKGFYLLTVLYKQYISTDFHGWLFLFALISGIAIMFAFKEYAEDFGMSCYLFIATACFVNLINGMRQFTCVAIIFAASKLVVERKYIKYVLIILLLSTLHASALIFIPLCLVMNAKPWSMRMFITIAASVIVGLNFEYFSEFFGNILEETQYSGYVSYISEQGVGSNIIRLAISIIPVILSFAGRRIIEREGNQQIALCINMSTINACLYFIASLTSGMVIGRLILYFDIYNLILLPWLINHVFTFRSQKLVKMLCFVMYLAYFYYQMVVTWNLPYESDILGLYFY